MCTAITYLTNHHYFGRNLDLERSYIEEVAITPRSYPFKFRHTLDIDQHYAMIGMAAVVDDYPLYYDATNEHGLSMAGLNFPGNAVYLPFVEEKVNIAPFEFIPYILGQCKNLAEAEQFLKDINLIRTDFSKQLPLTPLHWMIADKHRAIVVEPCKDGIFTYENPVGVLTNNPPFDYHLQNLSNYLNLTNQEPTNRFSSKVNLNAYSRGMGAIGLPGDLSSASRFIRAAFTKLNSVTKGDEYSSITQFFHILSSVAQQEGCVQVGEAFEKTIYSSCCNTDKGIYYYTTYSNHQITAVALFNENLDYNKIVHYPLFNKQNILYVNNQ